MAQNNIFFYDIYAWQSKHSATDVSFQPALVAEFAHCHTKNANDAKNRVRVSTMPQLCLFLLPKHLETIKSFPFALPKLLGTINIFRLHFQNI